MRAATLHEVVDQIARARDESAIAATERLAESARKDVDAGAAPTGQPQMLVRAPTPFTENTGAV